MLVVMDARFGLADRHKLVPDARSARPDDAKPGSDADFLAPDAARSAPDARFAAPDTENGGADGASFASDTSKLPPDARVAAPEHRRWAPDAPARWSDPVQRQRHRLAAVDVRDAELTCDGSADDDLSRSIAERRIVEQGSDDAADELGALAVRKIEPALRGCGEHGFGPHETRVE